MDDESLTSFLESVSVFSAFSKAEIANLAASAEVQRFNFGDSVYKAGEPSEGLYVVRSGVVRIFTAEEEKEISMGVRKEGAVFSEIGILGKFPHDSSVRASGKTELLFFPREHLPVRVLDLLDGVHHLLSELLQACFVVESPRLDTGPRLIPNQALQQRLREAERKRRSQRGRQRLNRRIGCQTLAGEPEVVCRAEDGNHPLESPDSVSFLLEARGGSVE